MAPRLQLLSLGPPLLLTERGEEIRFRTRKHFALLIRLAVEAEKSFTRDYLMDLLWPGLPMDQARHSLAQALTVVTRTLGREQLQRSRMAVALPAGVIDADVANLDRGPTRIRGPFLDGFEVEAVPFEQWKTAWRAKLMPRIRDCLVGQMDAARRLGEFAAVERHAQVLLDLDPLSEDAVRGLMEARAWVGDRSGALVAYHCFKARLREELGAQPTADLARVARLLEEGRRPGPHPAAPGRVLERQERRFEAETLLGREAEFAQLYDAWLDVRRSRPRIVALMGDAGVGKTTLANAFVSTCQMEGAVVARAQAYDAERELPFAVLAELIRQLSVQRALGAADPEALSELARVSVEILEAFPGVPKPADWSAEVIPLRLAGALLKTVEAVTEGSPLVLVVDDVHAADNASAAILHVLARKLPHTRLLLILTARASELRAAAAPAALVSDNAIQALQTLDLEPLPSPAAERLVEAITTAANGRPAGVPVDRILRASNGNPLALELLTKEWLAHGSSSLLADLEALNTQPVATLGIPRAIGAVFERQMRRLDPSTRTALDLAAVLGRRLADLSLYSAVGLSPAVAGEAISRLRDEGFFREVHGSLEFRNELIRAQAYYGVAGPARQHLHRSVAEVLAERAKPDARTSRIEIAWHFLRGDDAGRALAHGIAGAEDMLRVGAPYEAEQVLVALSREPESTPSRRHVSVLLARALLDQSKAETALPILDELVGASDLSAKQRAEVTRMQATGIYLVNQDSGQAHFEAADKALIAATSVNDPELVARALFEYARSGVAAGDEGRVRAARQLIAERLQSPDAAELPVLHYAQGFCNYFLFEPQAAATSLERARCLLANTRNTTELSFILNGYGNCKYSLCEFLAAQTSYKAGLELALRVGDDSRASIISANLCGALTTLGDYREAIQFGERGLALGNRALNQPMLAVAFTSLAEAYILGGLTHKALDCLDRARDWAARQRSWSARVEYLCQSACVSLMMGNLSLALDLIGSAEQAAKGRERSVPIAGVFAKLRILRAAHVRGPEAALEISEEAKARFRGRHPLYYLIVLAAVSWLEKWAYGRHSRETEEELEVLREPGLAGLRNMQAAQGFLT